MSPAYGLRVHYGDDIADTGVVIATLDDGYRLVQWCDPAPRHRCQDLIIDTYAHILAEGTGVVPR